MNSLLINVLNTNEIYKKLIYLILMIVFVFYIQIKSIGLAIFFCILALDSLKTSFRFKDLFNGLSVIFLYNNSEYLYFFLIFNLIFEYSLISKLAILFATLSIYLNESNLGIMFFIIFFFYEFSFKNIITEEKNYLIYLKNALLPLVFINNFKLDISNYNLDQFFIMAIILVLLFIKFENSYLRRKNSEILILTTLVFLATLTGYKKVLSNLEYVLILISLIKIDEKYDQAISKKLLHVVSYQNVLILIFSILHLYYYKVYQHWLFIAIPIISIFYINWKNKIFKKLIRKKYTYDVILVRTICVVFFINWIISFR
jgi:hypothetical protein